MSHLVLRSEGLSDCVVLTSLSRQYLKMWTAHTLGDLLKQRLLDLLELRRLDDVENLLDFPQEHDLPRGKERQRDARGRVRSGWLTLPADSVATHWQITSFWLQVLGQNFRSPRITCTDDRKFILNLAAVCPVGGSKHYFYTPYTNLELEALCFE